MSKEKRAVYLTEEQIEVVDSIKRNSREKPEMWDMSDSEAIRELVNVAIEHLGEKPALEELVDKIDRVKWQNQQRHEARRKKADFADMAGGWRGRVRKYLNQRLAGTEPHPPEKVEILAESYMGDIVDWERDPETLERNYDAIEDHREWLDDMVEEYRDAFEAKGVLPDEAFENHDDVETGSDLLRLRDHFDDVLLTVAELAEGDAYDVDAIYRRLAGDYAVEEETVELVVEKLTGDDVDARRALKSGEGILDAVDRQALQSWGGDPSVLEEATETDVEEEPAEETASIEEAPAVEEAPVVEGAATDGGEADAEVLDVETVDDDRGEDPDGIDAAGVVEEVAERLRDAESYTSADHTEEYVEERREKRRRAAEEKIRSGFEGETDLSPDDLIDLADEYNEERAAALRGERDGLPDVVADENGGVALD